MPINYPSIQTNQACHISSSTKKRNYPFNRTGFGGKEEYKFFGSTYRFQFELESSCSKKLQSLQKLCGHLTFLPQIIKFGRFA